MLAKSNKGIIVSSNNQRIVEERRRQHEILIGQLQKAHTAERLPRAKNTLILSAEPCIVL